MKKFLYIFVLAFVILVFTNETRSQEVHVTYSIGKTSAYLIMNLDNGAGIVKWKKGKGLTELNFAGQDDEGNEVWKEYEIGNGKKKYTGKFVFYSSSLSEGYYLRKDGKSFNVSK